MLQVAVGVVKNQDNEVLITQRAVGADQGGLWEFPGGKLETNETSRQALKRELFEEVGIHVRSLLPLITISHQYPKKNVHLDVYLVTAYDGIALGKEGQPLRWVPVEELLEYAFPAANHAIIKAIQLPDCYPIVDSSVLEIDQMLDHLEQLIKQGHAMIQFRAKDVPYEQFIPLANKAIALSNAHNVSLFMNTSIKKAVELKAEAVHLSSTEAEKALGMHHDLRLAMSCHNEEDIERAHALNADFVVLSPVNKTMSHPDITPLGWQRFKGIASRLNIPVYALGGVTKNDVTQAKEHGAQGVSGIRGFLN